MEDSVKNSVNAVAPGNITEGVLANIRRWHGSIDDQFSNIDNLVNLVNEHQTTWPMPSDLLQQLTGNRNQLQTLINKCRTTAASQADRTLRNTLLKSTAGLCLLNVKIWAYSEFAAGVITVKYVFCLLKYFGN
ncbi:MAG: hypothetical protein LBK94_01510 [Prevotellaceae bacterium]|jgi:hypothetical protein|nr:hypothetical protein [Prevotellaceae bacterium]